MDAESPCNRRTVATSFARQLSWAVRRQVLPAKKGFVLRRSLLPLAVLCCVCGCSSLPSIGEPRQTASSNRPSPPESTQEVMPESDPRNGEGVGTASKSKSGEVPPRLDDGGGTVDPAKERIVTDEKVARVEESSRESLAGALKSLRSADRIAALERIDGADPELEAAVRAALTDTDLAVRLAAVAALGRIHTPTARDELRRLAEAEGEAFRAAAAKALVMAGDMDALRRAASDRSPYVRLHAARLLAEVQPSDRPDDQVGAAAWRLLQDPGGDIQVEVIRSVSRWPWRQAAPLFLQGLASQVFAARKLSHERLSERWPPARDFPWQAAPAENAALLDALREEFAKAYPLGGDREATRVEAVPPDPVPRAASPERQP
ncbi:HEAT repeat domain-containing protein [Thermopirellula anaerolimosa]